jgi:hypothetical protein
MAGARLPLAGRGRLAVRRLEAAVVRDFLEAFGVAGTPARRLLAAGAARTARRKPAPARR